MDANTAKTDDSAKNWEQIATAHTDWIRSRVLRRVDDSAAADDITQDVLLAALEKRGESRQIQDLRPWLYRVLVNRVAEYYRRKYANERREQGYADQRLETQVTHPIDSGLIQAENRAQLHQAIQQLTSEDKKLMEMKFRDEMSYQEIARCFETTDRAIEYRLVRVKQQLRDRMMNHEQ